MDLNFSESGDENPQAMWHTLNHEKNRLKTILSHFGALSDHSELWLSFSGHFFPLCHSFLLLRKLFCYFSFLFFSILCSFLSVEHSNPHILCLLFALWRSHLAYIIDMVFLFLFSSVWFCLVSLFLLGATFLSWMNTLLKTKLDQQAVQCAFLN